MFHHIVQLQGGIAARAQPGHAHFGEQAEHVHDGQIDAIAGQLPVAGEPGLVFESESPGQGAVQIDAVPLGQLSGAQRTGGRIARVLGAVAVGVLRDRASGAAFRVVLADDDGSRFEYGNGGTRRCRRPC